MSASPPPAGFRDFRCPHCSGAIRIPENLPPTTAPCPMCGTRVTSPAPPAPPAPPAAPVTQPAPAPPVPPAREVPPQAMPTAPPARGERLPRDEMRAPHPASPPGRRPTYLIAGVVTIFIAVVAIIAAAGYYVYGEMTRAPDPQPAAAPAAAVEATTAGPASVEDRFIRIGWKTEARDVLTDFMAATNVEGKLEHVLRPDLVRARMEDFYGDAEIHDEDTPAEAFSTYLLSEEDRRRGMFLMTYDQPPHFDIRRFFRPLATIEVQYDLEEQGMLLSELSRARNFSLEPVRCHAFFKLTDDGLKLDWDIFAQTKYRTFRNFVELPEPGHAAVFRLLVLEDVPERGQAVSGSRTYRFADPANKLDAARVNVPVDSDIGRILSVLNWRGTEETKPIVKNATVELKWSDDPENPVLGVSRFICWEFLGLGGRPEPGTFDGY